MRAPGWRHVVGEESTPQISVPLAQDLPSEGARRLPGALAGERPPRLDPLPSTQSCGRWALLSLDNGQAKGTKGSMAGWSGARLGVRERIARAKGSRNPPHTLCPGQGPPPCQGWCLESAKAALGPSGWTDSSLPVWKGGVPSKSRGTFSTGSGGEGDGGGEGK